MEPDELLEIALRVLSSCVAYRPPDPSDIQALRDSVAGPEAHWEADALARHVIERRIGKGRSQSAAGRDG